MRAALLTLAATALAGCGWWLGGWAANAAGLGDLQWPASFAGVLIALAAGQTVQTRLSLIKQEGVP